MKTAISIPDEVFKDAERLARRMKRSRSELYSRAIAEYVARHTAEQVTEQMERVVSELGEQKDPFVSAAADHILRNIEW